MISGAEGNQTALFPLSNKYGPDENWSSASKILSSRLKVGTSQKRLTEASLAQARILVLIEPQEPVPLHIVEHMESIPGLWILIFCSTDEAVKPLLERVGISLVVDEVVSLARSPYGHPMEARITDPGCRVRDLADVSMSLVYPFGCTLEVSEDAGGEPRVIATTGSSAMAFHRPIIAASFAHRTIVCGSPEIFSDDYLTSESNVKLWLSLIAMISQDTDALPDLASTCPPANQYGHLSDIAALASQPLTPFEGTESIGTDVEDLFVPQYYQFSVGQVTESTENRP